jgi:hypothetical protein
MVPGIGLVRMTRLPQGWTNSVSAFQRIIGKAHWILIPDSCRSFIDDVGLKDPRIGTTMLNVPWNSAICVGACSDLSSVHEECLVCWVDNFGIKVDDWGTWDYNCAVLVRCGWKTACAKEGTTDSGLADTTITTAGTCFCRDGCVLSDFHFWFCIDYCTDI